MSQHGKDCVLKLDNAAGSLQTLTTYGMEVNTSWSVDNHDTTTFGNTGHKNTVGLQNNEFTVVWNYDPTIYTHLTGLFQLATTTSFEIHPKGTTSTYPKETGECNLISLDMPRSATDVEKITAKFKVDGAVAFGTN
jgi:hypothetical protein